jgi:hypothetical protein
MTTQNTALNHGNPKIYGKGVVINDVKKYISHSFVRVINFMTPDYTILVDKTTKPIPLKRRRKKRNNKLKKLKEQGTTLFNNNIVNRKRSLSHCAAKSRIIFKALKRRTAN